MYECRGEHAKGHRTEEARDACLAKQERRAKREAKKEADILRRENNCAREPVDDYVKRRFCIEQTPAVSVAASLNRDYPRRDRPYDWVSIIEIHAGHLRWPGPGQFERYLEQNPKVLLPSELRAKFGVSAESPMNET